MVELAPLRSGDPLTLPTRGSEGELWEALLDVADRQPDGWTLVGGLMVFLHAYESGLSPARVTRDLDAVVAARSVTQATRRLSATLLGLGWELDAKRIKAEDTGFRFARASLFFDVLAPEGLGRRVDLTTVPPAKSVPVEGGTRALERTERIAVRLGERNGVVPRPDSLGALVIKSRAAVLDKARPTDPTRGPERHVEDLALLYAGIADPEMVRSDTSKTDLKKLRSAPEPAWEILGDARLAATGQAARRIILGS